VRETIKKHGKNIFEKIVGEKKTWNLRKQLFE
jgi:hypothetical protein